VLREFQFDGLRGRLGQIQTPTLVMWGAQDRLIPVTVGHAMVSGLGHAALERFSGVGHALPEEAPSAFNRALLTFLQRGLPAPPENVARLPALAPSVSRY
jgi:2-hydroxy-6-oxonona-2,4-dienedioate hydrolase